MWGDDFEKTDFFVRNTEWKGVLNTCDTSLTVLSGIKDTTRVMGWKRCFLHPFYIKPVPWACQDDLDRILAQRRKPKPSFRFCNFLLLQNNTKHSVHLWNCFRHLWHSRNRMHRSTLFWHNWIHLLVLFLGNGWIQTLFKWIRKNFEISTQIEKNENS